MTRLQVGYLCTTLRPVIDASFQGDVRAMRHIISQVLEEQTQFTHVAEGQADDKQQGRNAPPTRGIVIAAGGGTYVANAFANLYVLQRHLNCTLPVAIM